jgi:predicted O-methyltransferase YrrM
VGTVSVKSIGLPDDLHQYLVRVGTREPEVLRRLREFTASLPDPDLQIAPEQGAFMAWLVRLAGARRCLELGTFTGYSALAVTLALPPDGTMLCCDINEEWTRIARRFWAEAGVSDRIELRLGPALSTLDALLADGRAGGFDFAFVDADKSEYPAYYDRLIDLVQRGGIMLWDNVLWGGEVIRPEADDRGVRGIRELNDRLVADERVEIAMLPLADGVTLVRKL